MHLKFIDILDKLNLNEDDIKGLSNTVVSKNDTNTLDLLSDYYYNAIFKDGYCVSVEDIALILDLSLEGVNKLIIKNIDRIEFPSSQYRLKGKIKSNLKDKYFWNPVLKSNNKVSSEGIPQSYFNDRFNKRVLYNIHSLIDFLEGRTSLISDPINVHLKFDANIILPKVKNKILDIENKKDITEILRSLIQVIVNKDSSDIKYTNIKNFINFKTYIEQLLAPPIVKKENKNLLTDSNIEFRDVCLRSARSLSVLFSTIYLKKINDIVANSPNSLVLKINIDNSKNPLKRYLLAKKELIETIEYNLNNFKNYTDIYDEESEDLNNESLEKGDVFYLKITVPKHYYSSKFNYEEDKLKSFIFNSLI